MHQLPREEVSLYYGAGWTDHASAWEDVPAQTDSIAILNLTPLLLQSVVVHCEG
jgi:hypothetical protein